MIHYDLRCGGGHLFDGWFRSSTAFDEQAAAGLLDCPVCAVSDVSRAPMAPSLNRGVPVDRGVQAGAAGKLAIRPELRPMPAAPTTSVSLPPMPDQMRAALQRIRAEVERKCDYVGPRFAEAARAMRDGSTPPRPIYGETTPEQAEALAEDGIEVASIPWVPRADG